MAMQEVKFYESDGEVIAAKNKMELFAYYQKLVDDETAKEIVLKSEIVDGEEEKVLYPIRDIPSDELEIVKSGEISVWGGEYCVSVSLETAYEFLNEPTPFSIRASYE